MAWARSRSMAARDRLGGLAGLTVAAMVLMRAVYDIVLIETIFDTLNAKAALFAIEAVFDAVAERQVDAFVSWYVGVYLFTKAYAGRVMVPAGGRSREGRGPGRVLVEDVGRGRGSGPGGPGGQPGPPAQGLPGRRLHGDRPGRRR